MRKIWMKFWHKRFVKAGKRFLTHAERAYDLIDTGNVGCLEVRARMLLMSMELGIVRLCNIMMKA